MLSSDSLSMVNIYGKKLENGIGFRNWLRVRIMTYISKTFRPHLNDWHHDRELMKRLPPQVMARISGLVGKFP